MAETVKAVDPLIGHVIDSKYQILAQLGKGGMGVVYRAERVLVGDEVALKILRGEFVAEEETVERFRREARAAAKLRHPNVVTIYDYGEARGADAPAYIVMELLNGGSLRDLLKRESRLQPERAIQLMRGICAGIGLAHRRHIVHRDIKPDNIILLPADEEEGREQEMVKVVDFGIAKLRDAATGGTLTQKGFQPGTSYYMSPEQCRGDELDARSDVYSLGALLYEMLEGIPPFVAETHTGIISKHLFDPPPSFSKELHIWPSLETVVMRALAKERDARPTDATVLGRELQEAEQQERATRELRAEEERQRVEAEQRRAEEARQREEAVRLKAEEEVRQRQAEEERLRVETAERERWEEVARQARKEQEEYERQAMIPSPIEESRARNERGVQTPSVDETVVANAAAAISPAIAQQNTLRANHSFVERASEPVKRQPEKGKGRGLIIGAIAGVVVLAVAISLILYATRSQSTEKGEGEVKTSPPPPITQKAPESINLRQTLDNLGGKVWSVAFSPDGSSMAAAGEDKKVRIWSASSWNIKFSLEGHSDQINSVAFSPDGKTLASGGTDKSIRLWNVNDGSKIREFGKLEGRVLSVAFSTDGKMLASAGADQPIYLWDVSTGEKVGELKGHTDQVWTVAFSPDGTTLASVSRDGKLKLWSVKDRKEIRTIATSGPISLSFAPGGNMMATCHTDKSVKLWNWRTGEKIRELTGHSGVVTSVTFTRDSTVLASASTDKTIKIWDVQSGLVRQTLTEHQESVESVGFSPDGQTLMSGSRDQTVRIWQ